MATCARTRTANSRGRNILYQAHSVEETAAHFGAPVEDVHAALARSRGRSARGALAAGPGPIWMTRSSPPGTA